VAIKDRTERWRGPQRFPDHLVIAHAGHHHVLCRKPKSVATDAIAPKISTDQHGRGRHSPTIVARGRAAGRTVRWTFVFRHGPRLALPFLRR
jgi:hypothetical protein